MEETSTSNATPPVIRKRNAHGLYEHLNYVFKEDGSVDWLKMIPNKYFVANKEKTQETDITKLSENELLVLLEGLREVAVIRGYTSLSQTVVSPSSDFVTAVTTITWLPNYETEGVAITCSGIADAHPANTEGFATNFLAAIAENRSEVRAIRKFLRIPVLGQDEMNSAVPTSESVSGRSAEIESPLAGLLAENGIKFESFKNRMVKMKMEGAENWQSLADVRKEDEMQAITNVKEVLTKRAQAAKAKAEAEAAE